MSTRIVTCLCFVVLCCPIALPSAVAQQVTVGSFNIRFFGGSDDYARSAEEIKSLAGYIKKMDCDIVCCQEIDHAGDANEDGKRGRPWAR